MLNFNDLKLTIKDSYSFVGIAKEEDALIFYLPKGMSLNFERLNQFAAKRDLFFQIYRVLRRFKSICQEKGYLEQSETLVTRDRDGILQGERGAEIVQHLDEELVFYSKIDEIGALLEAYDELKILGLAYRLSRTDQVDHSQIYQYLHQGVFFGNGAVYVDTMNLPRQQVQAKATDIVAMYCYLVVEVKTQLEDEIHPEIAALAEQFRQRYLGAESSLFNEFDQAMTSTLLREALDTIDQQTALKDVDYDLFYDAIAAFLYGRWQNTEQGEIWGISNFHMVWESMCLTQIAECTDSESILWLDTRFVPDSLLQQINASAHAICLDDTFTCNGAKLIPDAVVFPAFQGMTNADSTPSYYLSYNNWNDYGYCTTFQCKKPAFRREIKIAFVDQPTKSHTINELRQFYPGNNQVVTVSTPLPLQFYSFWQIDDDVDLKLHWMAMRYFNHIFYRALQQGIWTAEKLKQLILNPLQIENSRRSENVFNISLFRDHSVKAIQNEFNAFVQRILMFQIIDVKYLTLEYLQDKQNIEEVKSRSIRKQFVYEYLLQRKLQIVSERPNIQPIIKSSFWIPGSRSSLPEIDYLNGYLDLTQIDVTELMKRYT